MTEAINIIGRGVNDPHIHASGVSRNNVRQNDLIHGRLIQVEVIVSN